MDAGIQPECKLGLIRNSFKADIVLFEPAKVIDRATFQQPQLISDGVKRVFVNGVEVWRDGSPTGNRPEIAIRKH
jgi:N-acyl-D-aspartate/D-glutamate deacylase